MLMNLKRMRRIYWNNIWKSITLAILPRTTHSLLADQDVMNSALLYNRNRVFRLPCNWNVQLTDNANYSNCIYGYPSEADWITEFLKSENTKTANESLILHWNRQQKAFNLTNSDDLFAQLGQRTASYLREVFRRKMIKIAALDGEFFRKNQYGKVSAKNQENGHSLNSIEADLTPCSSLREDAKLRRRIHPYFFGSSTVKVDKIDVGDSIFKSIDITLVSHLSFDRLHRFEEIAIHWEGPISVAVYLTDQDTTMLSEFMQTSPILSKRRNISIHILFKEGNFYPINSLRNIAMKYSETDHLFLLDFDFVPNKGIYEYLKLSVGEELNNQRYIKSSIESGNDSKTVSRLAFVVPAFETFYTQLHLPQTKSELLNQIDAGIVVPFRYSVWQAGHMATNYTRWYNTSTKYKVKWKSDFEPYVVIARSEVKFDERFVGFGWNKVAYTMLLDALGYTFIVVPEAFVIHLPHPPSMESNRFRNLPYFRKCLEQFKTEYIKELASIYGVKALKYLNHS